jgi:hypothetical protein
MQNGFNNMNKKKLVSFVFLSVVAGFLVMFIDAYIYNIKNETISLTSGNIFTGADTFMLDVYIFLITAGYVTAVIIVFYNNFFKKENKKKDIPQEMEFFPKE